MIDVPQWFCLQTRPKNENITCQFLRTEIQVEVFCPFIRFQKARRTGKVWVTEAMFPGYVFARFLYSELHRQVQATRGVVKIVRFGTRTAIVPDEIIVTLRDSLHDEETILVETVIQPGEEVNLVEGPFRGLRAIVTKVLPAKDRIAVLLELLGIEREVEIPTHSVLPDTVHPLIRQYSN